ncbi:DinB family protein [Paenibacillus eucommiae]|uniref:Damage-inducible protein DinB n=1 Tax=Paenibacillus eucommiae TaxID=1355755 RepID=A0ABS4JBW7_9BACL|nr:DinB family protein [Paenibacillus eucommiae]MBP1996581.1 putative damage-inducible protein DinB [Paenibacillus eucommiae]
MKHYMMQQYDYHAWANNKVCAYLAELPEPTCFTSIQSIFPTIYDVLVHIYVIDSGWLSILATNGVAEFSPEYVEELTASTERLTNETKGKSLSEMGEMLSGLANRYHACFEQQQNVEAFCSYGDFNARYIDLVQHVVNHGTYHRGNITAMLRQLGHAGTQTDFSLYLYLQGK